MDLSEESLEENIGICSAYLKRMAKIGMTLEIELGCTGGEEDGVDSSHMDLPLCTPSRKTWLTRTKN
ncbi:class II fructose-bisphosphate aldolase [Serratia ureilytica]